MRLTNCKNYVKKLPLSFKNLGNAEFAIFLFQPLFVVMFIISLIKTSYFNVDLNSILSFMAAEPPAGPEVYSSIKPTGVHFFGDYLLSSYWSQLPNPWIVLGPSNYPPFALQIFELFSHFQYSTGLWLYLSFMLISLVLPFIVNFYQNKSLANTVLIFTVGLLNTPLLSSLDRGNISGYVASFMFFGGYFLLKDRIYLAAFFIAVAAAIKIYPAILFLIFLSTRKFAALIFGLLVSALLFFGTFLLYTGSYLDTLKSFILSIRFFTSPDPNSINCMNVSYIGGLSDWLKILDHNYLNQLVLGHLFQIQIILLLISSFLIFSKNIELWLKIVIGMSLTVTIPTLQYAYTMNWAIAALAITLFVSNGKNTSTTKEFPTETSLVSVDSSSLKKLTAAMLILLLVPWPFALPPSVTSCSTSILPLIFFAAYSIFISCLLVREIKLRSVKHVK